MLKTEFMPQGEAVEIRGVGVCEGRELERQPFYFFKTFSLMASGKHVLFMYSEIRQRYVFLLTDALAAMTAYTELCTSLIYPPQTDRELFYTLNRSSVNATQIWLLC